MPRKMPNPTDVHVGARVRMRRMMLSMSQEKLADALDLTFQQVQKNEKGANRIGASRLQQLSQILQVPIAWFFEGAPQTFEAGAQNVAKMGAPMPDYASKFLATTDGLTIAAAFSRIKDPVLRRKIADLVEAVAPHEEAARKVG